MTVPWSKSGIFGALSWGFPFCSLFLKERLVELARSRFAAEAKKKGGQPLAYLKKRKKTVNP